MDTAWHWAASVGIDGAGCEAGELPVAGVSAACDVVGDVVFGDAEVPGDDVHPIASRVIARATTRRTNASLSRVIRACTECADLAASRSSLRGRPVKQHELFLIGRL